MSNLSNDIILDEVQFHIDFWQGTVLAKMLEYALETKDLEQLSKLMHESRMEMFDLEYRPTLSEWKIDTKNDYNLGEVPF